VLVLERIKSDAAGGWGALTAGDEADELDLGAVAEAADGGAVGDPEASEKAPASASACRAARSSAVRLTKSSRLS
jgi:hypothetical protein